MSEVWVFGSNRAGIHGKGSALEAYRKHGAIYGQGEGRQGNSYAIPTKKTPYITLPLTEINEHAQIFIQYASEHPEDSFHVVRIGCSLAGYKDSQIAPMFENASSNVILPDEWKEYLNNNASLSLDDLYDYS